MRDSNVDLDDTDDTDDTDNLDATAAHDDSGDASVDDEAENDDDEPGEGAPSDVAAAPSDIATAPSDMATGDEVRRLRPPVDKGLLAACFVIACGLFAIIWGVGSAITGDEGIDRPDAIENLSPVENAQQVFQQQQVRVDLQAGFEAVLVIDGIELETTSIGQVVVNPENDGQQLSIPPTAVFDPGNNVITFRPSDDAVITSFSEGRHNVQVIFWMIEEGRESARSYRWSFDVV
ncbi:MAG: hypothetical protein AB8G26_07200 [Ilumatobacter sp.]